MADTSSVNRRVLPLVALALVAGVLGGWFFLREPQASGPVVPDVRGNIPVGRSYESHKWIRPLLDAGFCVDFVYNRDATASIDYGNGKFSTTADAYVISAESPSPGSHATSGSTVTVTVGGTPLGGPERNWDAEPLTCPGS